MTHPTLSHLVMRERSNDFARAADRARFARRTAAGEDLAWSSDIVIRDARPSDADAVARLARLDGRPTPTGPAVIASVGGSLRAAVAANGDAVSDPFVPTEDLVALLRLRARQRYAH